MRFGDHEADNGADNGTGGERTGETSGIVVVVGGQGARLRVRVQAGSLAQAPGSAPYNSRFIGSKRLSVPVPFPHTTLTHKASASMIPIAPRTAPPPHSATSTSSRLPAVCHERARGQAGTHQSLHPAQCIIGVPSSGFLHTQYTFAPFLVDRSRVEPGCILALS